MFVDASRAPKEPVLFILRSSTYQNENTATKTNKLNQYDHPWGQGPVRVAEATPFAG